VTKMKQRLTDLGVKKLSLPLKGQVTYWDETTPGFGVRCSARSKSYVVMYGVRRRLKTLGRYPDLSLADARRKAKYYLTTVAQVPDPDPEYDYETVVEEYLRDCQARLRASTLEGYNVYLRGIRFSGPISAISQGEVILAIEQFTKKPSGQNYAFTTLKVFFNWAVLRQYLASNPLSALKRPHRTKSRERILSDVELKTLLTYALGERGRFNDIVSLLVLTGQRRGEIAGLLWSEIDGDRLVLPSARTKNKREHVLPLGPTAVELLNDIDGGRFHVFGLPDDDRPFNGWSKSQRRLLRATGLDHFTLHDLRRTFATIHAKLGTAIHVTEKLLNHSSGTISGVAAVYNRHSYLDEMRTAMDIYERYISDILKSD